MSIFNFRSQNREALGQKPQADDKGELGGGSFESKIEHANGFGSSPTVSAWYRGVELRAQAMSQLRMEFQIAGRGGNFTQYNRGDYARLNYLLQVRPNYYENAAAFARRKEILRIMKGNAYIYIERSGGDDVWALHLCQSANYIIGEDMYTITYSPTNISKTVPSDDIVHLKNTFTNQTGMEGIATLTYAARVLNISATNDKQALDIAAKGGRFKLLLTQAKEKFIGAGAKLSQKQMEERKKKMENDLFNGDVGVIPFGTEVQNISMSTADMQLLENRKFSVSEVGRFLGIPGSMLMDLTNANYKTAEHATLELYRTLAPLIHEEECEYNSKLIPPSEYGRQRFHLCEKPLFRLDLKSQALWNKSRLECGMATVNELRYEVDQPQIEGGDKLLLSANLKTIDMMEKEADNNKPAKEGGEE